MEGTAQRRIVMLHGHFDVSKGQALGRAGSASFDVEALQHILEHDNHHTRCLAWPQSSVLFAALCSRGPEPSRCMCAGTS
jgi:hypothetical protein